MKIVLVSLDCVRSDYFDPPDPIADGKGLFHFDTCITAASHTSTSHTTMLTGTYPFKHGVRWLIRYDIKNKMIQEILKEKGFRTGAFIGGFPLTQGNMDRGFDVYEHEPLVKDENEGRSHYVPVNLLVDEAVDFLNDSEGDKFVFIHVFDAHFTLRSEFDADHPPPEKDENGIYINIEDHLGRRKKRYIEEIEFIKEQINRLQELADIDLLVITADHGEKMQGEKGYPWVINHEGEHVGSHFHEVELFDIQLKVPLVFIGKGIPQGKSSEMVRTVDITPTVMDRIGFLSDSGECYDGISLMGMMKGDMADHIPYAYSETYFAQMNATNKHAVDMGDKFQWGWKGIDNLVSIRTENNKLICLANGRIIPYLFYNLKDDPEEENNIINNEDFMEIYNKLYTHLSTLILFDNQYKIGMIKKEKEKIDKIIRTNKIRKI